MVDNKPTTYTSLAIKTFQLEITLYIINTKLNFKKYRSLLRFAMKKIMKIFHFKTD